MAPDPERCLEFLQRLIRVPSLPGREGDLAELVRVEMQALGYDEVRLDAAGNVIGTVRGRGEAPAVVFNTHLDHVAPGNAAAWPVAPYSGLRRGGEIWGRGAVDIKGPLAAQVHGVMLGAATGEPPGDVHVTCVVQEEVGGLGARHLCRELTGELAAAVVVVGEPSANTLRRGHRGRLQLEVRFRGRSVHASVPERGANPLYALGRFLGTLETVPRGDDPELGPSSVAPTCLATDQESSNVVPGEVRLTIDWRTVPGEVSETVRARLAELAAEAAGPDVHAEVAIPVRPVRSWTGLEMEMAADNPAYVLRADHPAVEAAREVLSAAVGDPGPATLWRFATDGGHFAAAGVPPVGYGPGDDSLAHTSGERIAVAAVEQALAGNAALARSLGTALSGPN